MLFGAFASGIGAVSTNMREGPQYSVVYTLPAVAPLMFMSQLMAAPNGPLAVGLSLFPMTAPLGMIERLAVGAVPGWQIALSLVLAYMPASVAHSGSPAACFASTRYFLDSCRLAKSWSTCYYTDRQSM